MAVVIHGESGGKVYFNKTKQTNKREKQKKHKKHQTHQTHQKHQTHTQKKNNNNNNSDTIVHRSSRYGVRFFLFVWCLWVKVVSLSELLITFRKLSTLSVASETLSEVSEILEICCTVPNTIIFQRLSMLWSYPRDFRQLVTS